MVGRAGDAVVQTSVAGEGETGGVEAGGAPEGWVSA